MAGKSLSWQDVETISQLDMGLLRELIEFFPEEELSKVLERQDVKPINQLDMGLLRHSVGFFSEEGLSKVLQD